MSLKSPDMAELFFLHGQVPAKYAGAANQPGFLQQFKSTPQTLQKKSWCGRIKHYIKSSRPRGCAGRGPRTPCIGGLLRERKRKRDACVPKGA